MLLCRTLWLRSTERQKRTLLTSGVAIVDKTITERKHSVTSKEEWDVWVGMNAGGTERVSEGKNRGN